MFALTVIHPFGDYTRGQRITDRQEIHAVLGGENAHHTNRTGTPDEVAAALADFKNSAAHE